MMWVLSWLLIFILCFIGSYSLAIYLVVSFRFWIATIASSFLSKHTIPTFPSLSYLSCIVYIPFIFPYSANLYFNSFFIYSSACSVNNKDIFPWVTVFDFMIVTHLHSIFFCLFLSFPMFLFFLSFLFPVLFCLWVVCLLPSGLFAGFLYFVVCVDLFPDSGLEVLDLTFASPGCPSLLATFLLFLCFSLFLCLSFWFTVDFLFFSLCLCVYNCTQSLFLL